MKIIDANTMLVSLTPESSRSG